MNDSPFILTVYAPGTIIPSIIAVAHHVEVLESGDLQIILADGLGDIPDTSFTISEIAYNYYEEIPLTKSNVDKIKQCLKTLE